MVPGNSGLSRFIRGTIQCKFKLLAFSEVVLSIRWSLIVWPIQRGTTVVAKLFVDIDIAEGSH